MIKLRAVLVRRWPIVVASVLLGAVAGFVSSYKSSTVEKKVQYRAEQVIVSNRSENSIGGNVKQDALRMTRGDVLEAAADTLNEPDKTALASTIEIQTQSDQGSMTVYTFANTASVASKRIDAFVKSFLNVVNKELQQAETKKLEKLKERADTAVRALEAFDAANPLAATPNLLNPNDPATQVVISKRTKLENDVDRAKTNYDDAVVLFTGSPPYSSLGAELPKVDQPELLSVPQNPLFRAGLLAATALALAAMLILIIERVNRRIDTREELAMVTGIPIVAEIGHLTKNRRTFHTDGRIRLEGVWAEHYRRIRSAVQFVQIQNRRAEVVATTPRPGAPLITGPGGDGTLMPSSPTIPGGTYHPERVFMITSTLPGEGKSTSTALTAMALAEVGVETVVINADFRKPRVDVLLGSDTSVTMADLAQLDVHRPSIDQVVRPTSMPHLWTAASGPPTYDVGLRLEAAREIAEEAARRGATVLIDSTPIRVANDTVDLLPVVDEVLLVVRTGRTTVESLHDTIELLELHSASVLGIILIGSRASRELYAYYDSYYSGVEGSEGSYGGRRKSRKTRYGPDSYKQQKSSKRKRPAESPEAPATPGPLAQPPVPVAAPAAPQVAPIPQTVPATPPPLPAGLPVPPPVGPMVGGAPQAPPVAPPPWTGTAHHGNALNGSGANGTRTATVPPPYQPPSSN
ncbi:MAG: hypothetical protein ACKOYM_11135 [Actinomycetes bacterium]